MDRYEGFSGWWLRNEAAEAFVIARPWPRVPAFRMLGGVSPLRVDSVDACVGVRTWFLEPVQSPESERPASRPAKCEIIDPLRLVLTAECDEITGLQLVMDLELDPSAARLRIRHGLVNCGDTARRLAVWVIVAVRHEGVGVTPWRRGGADAIVWPGCDPADPSLRIGETAMGVDFRVPPTGGAFKAGAPTDAGWIAQLRPDGALRSTVAVDADAEYPEGGGTVTFYNGGQTSADGWSEIENVGPLTDLGDGRTLWMDQTLELLPDARLVGDDPDTWAQCLHTERMTHENDRG